MTHENAIIRHYVDVRPHPTVVRLQDLSAPDAGWLSESFLLTPDVHNHIQALTRLLDRKTGCGVFLIGHYGSGKSHFLAYLTQQLQSAKLVSDPPEVMPLSLVNFSAANRLEDIIGGELGIRAGPGDRRPAWDAMLAARPRGLLLLIDELSEFLRAKSDNHAFTEDVRLLQFLGEWAQDKPCWIVAAMQEGIEHTGELEYGLYRKIKDRYPVRLLLSPAHVKSLIADSILVKTPAYDHAVANLCQGLREAYPASALDFETLRAVYPLHPATLDLLEEVRDRFSQARGVVDFTVTRLRGDSARGVEPFLDQPFGGLITPDAIVDHFRDLLEVQPEFLPIAQQVFTWYQRHMEELFERPALRALAEKLLKLLVLVHLSPARENLSANEAAAWLLFSAARIDPARNRKIVERVLHTLTERGRYVGVRGARYHLNLRDDVGSTLDRLLAREIAELKAQTPLVLETLLPILPEGGFNPFALPRDEWQHRRVLWQFHERRYAVWLGDQTPTPIEGIGLCLRLPWGEAAPAPKLFTVQPSPIAVTADLVELAALVRLKERPGNPELTRRVQQRLSARGYIFSQAIRSAWQDARLISPGGETEPAPRLEAKATLDSWLESVALRVLRRIYPAFERFAPGHGPLAKEAWLRFMRFASHEDLGAAQADDYVRLIREGYLVPMGLLRRKGREYLTPPNLDRHELVRLVSPLLEHNPSPKTVHEYLAEPIYGLVPDQTNLLLVFLLLHGEIDILKDRKSYRETFETLPNPLQYDRLVPGHALGIDQINDLQRLCDGLNIRTPAHWTVLTQRRCVSRLNEVRRAQVERLQPLVRQLQGIEQGIELAAQLQQHIDRWNALDKGEHSLQGLEQFLFEIGSVSGFLEEVNTYESLPERIQRLLNEAQRYAYLYQHPAVHKVISDGELNDPGEAPALDQPQALEDWLRRADQIYQHYKQVYRKGHASWCQSIADHPIWSWKTPILATSHHLGLGEMLTELETCRGEASKLRCRGLVNLDYQPQCTCGYDGHTAPIAASIDRFNGLRETMENRLRLFFQQDEIKARLREWQREGLEMNSETISYLEGNRPYPEVQDVGSLDQYLSGIQLAYEMDVTPILETLTQRVWEPAELMAELERQILVKGEKRVRFTGRDEEGISQQLLEWCAAQCVRFGVTLPSGLNREARRSISCALKPEWVSSESLCSLESLGLDDAGIDHILEWLLDGHIPLPEGGWPHASILTAVSSVLNPERVTTTQLLAALSWVLYRAHPRLLRVAGDRWLERLDTLATTPLEPQPTLGEILKTRTQAQWLMVDCLGLPLLQTLQPVLFKVFSEWTHSEPQFAEVSTTTTTDACYRELLDTDIRHTFEKINVVDELIHDGFTPFSDLITLAATQLEIASKRLISRFDPTRALLMFADHGFRIAPDGRSYTHGRASTLERVVPIWFLEPR